MYLYMYTHKRMNYASRGIAFLFSRYLQNFSHSVTTTSLAGVRLKKARDSRIDSFVPGDELRWPVSDRDELVGVGTALML